MKYILATFCNLPTSTRVPLACVQITGKGITPLPHAPVSIGFPGIISTATGLTSDEKNVYVLFASQDIYYVAILRRENLQPLGYQELPEVKDGHSLMAYAGCLYVISTGTDQVIGYDIRENRLENPRVIWQASDTMKDTHHVNSIIQINGELIISAFGPKEGQMWASAKKGYLYNITRNEMVKEDIYHPHSLSSRRGKIYYTESQNNTLCSVEDGALITLDGYTRGLSWLSDNMVCIASSIGRKISRSTKLVANPGDPGEPAGKCGLFIGNIKTRKIVAQIDLSNFGPEIYEALALEIPNLDLLQLANTSHIAERNAVQELFKLTETQVQQLELLRTTDKEHQSEIEDLKNRIVERDEIIQNLETLTGKQLEHIAVLEAEGNENKQLIQKLNSQLAAQNQEILALNIQIEKITSNPIWRSMDLLSRPFKIIKSAGLWIGRNIKSLPFRINIIRKVRIYFKIKENTRLLQQSDLFDIDWYLQQNPDVASARVDPIRHYLLYGGFEGRDPSPQFSSQGYLDAYPDVKNAGVNPLVHYLRYGEKEGRLPTNHPIENQNSESDPFNTLRRYIQSAKQTWQQEGIKAVINKALNKIRQQKFQHPKITPVFEGASPYKSVYEDMQNTARGKRGEEYVPLTDSDLSTENLPAKLLAFYLPQYHPIPENDMWWGKGFTEWTNVSKAIPQFVNHYQPHLPDELGFYDLRVPQVQERQVELARKYGLYGFCFYYYWFDGKTLLDYPLKQYVSNKDIDFPFCLCWANENWTRRWDGMDHEILIAQNHSQDSDIRFMRDIAPYLKDQRYIHINGRPLLLVYRANILKNPRETAQRWREFAVAKGLGNPYLVAAQVFGYRDDPKKIGFDASVEFPPNTLPVTDIAHQIPLLNPAFSGHIYDYDELAAIMSEHQPSGYKIFKGVTPSWDNTARQPDRPSIFVNATPKRYEDWLATVIKQTMRRMSPEERFVFINAWNEWAEGNHLEPDRKYGYAYLQATANALKRSRYQEGDWKILFVTHDAHPAGAQFVLLSIIRWFVEHTNIDVRVLSLEGGNLLPEFNKLTPTLLYTKIAKLPVEERTNKLIAFCQGIPDLVYINSVASGRILSWLKQLDSPILTHVHELNMSIQRYASEWIGEIVEHSASFIACSEAVRELLVERYGVDSQICSLAYSFIEPSGIEPLDEREKAALRKELGLEEDSFIVFGCGVGMAFRKGADLFIETAERLMELGEENFHFYWIGEFDINESHPRYGNWSKHAARLKKPGIKDHVTFLGQQDNPQRFMRAGDLFLLPSREEPLGRVMLEAAECELPTICFESSGGAVEFVSEDAGFSVPFENTQQMAEKVQDLIHDSLLRKQMGQKARQKFLEKFTLQQNAPKVLSAARKTASKPPKVSIILPNYNHAKYLPARLESIFNQTYQDFEVFLLDDASTDNSLQVFERYAHRGDVYIISNERNSGSPFTQWLKAFELVKGEILWIAESDDLCEQDFLERLLPAFQDSMVKLAYCASKIIDKQGNVVGNYTDSEYLQSVSTTRWRKNYCIPAEEEINEAFGIKNTILNISAVLFRKPQLDDKTRKTLQKLHIAGDTYLILNLIKGGKVFYDAGFLNYHRRHEQSIVGKVLAERGDSHLRGYFEDMSVIYAYIAEHFELKADFPEKLEKYFLELWQTLAPGRRFEELANYFPYDDIMERIRQNARKHTPPRPPSKISTTEEVVEILEKYKNVREAEARKWKVSSAIHREDMLFRFLLNAPKNIHNTERAIEKYFSDGYDSAAKIADLLESICDIDTNNNFDFLEFASGFGRVTRHLKNVLPHANLVACDIHPKAIEFISAELGVKAIISKDDPRDLTFDKKFDVVFALSFFSHLPKSSFAEWLTRLMGFTKPGGYLVFTTHGKHSIDLIPDCIFDEEGYFFRPGSEQDDLSPQKYGISCASPSFVIKEITGNAGWVVKYHQEGFWWEHQDLYIAQLKTGISPLK